MSKETFRILGLSHGNGGRGKPCKMRSTRVMDRGKGWGGGCKPQRKLCSKNCQPSPPPHLPHPHGRWLMRKPVLCGGFEEHLFLAGVPFYSSSENRCGISPAQPTLPACQTLQRQPVQRQPQPHTDRHADRNTGGRRHVDSRDTPKQGASSCQGPQRRRQP